MSAALFMPRGVDHQTSRAQDELYVVVTGRGVLTIEGVDHAFVAGHVLFVAASTIHRFTEFTQDLLTWAIFWEPQGGEHSAPRKRASDCT